jgi:hypothetical protein
MAIDCNTGGVTVSKVEPAIDWNFASMVVVPPVKVVARPAALMVAAVAFEEVHVAEPVRFCVLPSLKFPVAEYCSVRPAMTDGSLGLTVMDCKLGGEEL